MSRNVVRISDNFSNIILVTMPSKIIYLYPQKERNGDINSCINHVVKDIYNQCFNQNTHPNETPEENQKLVEYFNSTMPNKLYLIIKENTFSNEDALMKYINYTNVENLGDLINRIQAMSPQTGPIIIEKLSFIVKNTRMEYQEVNRLIIKLFRLLHESSGAHYVIEPYENYFMSNNCDSVIEVR